VAYGEQVAFCQELFPLGQIPFKAMPKANLSPVLDVDAKLRQKLADRAECLFSIFQYAIDPVLDVWDTIEHCVSRVSLALSYAEISSYPLDRTTENLGLLWRLINLEPEFDEFNYRAERSRAGIAHFETPNTDMGGSISRRIDGFGSGSFSILLSVVSVIFDSPRHYEGSRVLLTKW
jgi:hypothetical protein